MKWIKPNGTELETNDMKATIEYAKSLGWKEATKKAEKKKVVKIKKELTE